jgi:predicted DNA-binding transcriptional regulator YafY
MKGLLLRTLEKGEFLEMIYQSDKGILSQRVIKIEKLNGEYLIAFCYIRKQMRKFKLSNILSIAPIKSKYRKGA